ncbi:hypothetical protein WN48_08328 [Eufriesea mexicana]|uniref:Uncharacterized protein n=1 Tax=Eufriesea mexicana TaxID=516756 RepID=A0A310S7R9_9HYME|nr:hypothetical protein WN48_08328 [Eufriesea mexicana]
MAYNGVRETSSIARITLLAPRPLPLSSIPRAFSDRARVIGGPGEFFDVISQTFAQFEPPVISYAILLHLGSGVESQRTRFGSATFDER